jgi:hypothetical protein
MIPNTNYGKTITSGQMKTGSATIELTPEMFTLLSDGMYSDKILAAIREPICNARDAQVETGEKHPLEMHLPSSLEPFFHIRDRGEGLTERQVLGYTDETGEHVPGLYLRYGKSTKRDSNLQIGGFGIGCKAPLAYSDSFIVESYQQGVVKTYTIYKENGIPNVAKLTEKMTTEMDGLKVKIAVVNRDCDTFCEKAVEFLKFFDYEVTITGNRSRLSQMKPEYILTTPLYDTVRCSYADQGKIKACMGGVVYNVSDKYREELEQVVKTDMLLMKFNIGDLSVAGSRESLSEDDMTIAKLDAAVAKIRKEFFSVMKAEVEDPKHTPHAAIQVMKKFNLITTHWRNGTTISGAAKDFTIGGVDVGLVYNRYSAMKMRTITRQGDSQQQLTSFVEAPIVLEVDRGVGYLKVARKMYEDQTSGVRKTVILVNDALDLEQVKDFFGHDIAIDKVSVKYAEFFPKGVKEAGKVKVAKSGLFNTRGADITELDEGQEGFYIPFERFTCVMQGIPSEFANDRGINKVVKQIIDAGHLVESDVYYSRKTGMRAIKKTKLKELTWQDIVDLCKKCYTPQDYKDYNYNATIRSGSPISGKHKSFAKIWDQVKHNYPTWGRIKKDLTSKGATFFMEIDHSLRVILEPTVGADQGLMDGNYDVEEKQFNKDFPILDGFSSWFRLTDDLAADIVAFCEWKQIQASLAQVKAA